MTCFWCVCFVVGMKIVTCSPCSHGSKQELDKVWIGLKGKGNMFTAECPLTGEKPEVDWSDKEGFNLK